MFASPREAENISSRALFLDLFVGPHAVTEVVLVN